MAKNISTPKHINYPSQEPTYNSPFFITEDERMVPTEKRICNSVILCLNYLKHFLQDFILWEQFLMTSSWLGVCWSSKVFEILLEHWWHGSNGFSRIFLFYEKPIFEIRLCYRKRNSLPHMQSPDGRKVVGRPWALALSVLAQVQHKSNNFFNQDTS